MGKTGSNQKTNLVELVKYKKINGFSVLEVLVCILLAQMFWFFAWPHLKDFWQIQSCQIQIKQLQFLLGKARLEAVMGRQRQKILPLAQGDWLIGKRIFKSQHRLYWHGFNSLNEIVFESKLPLNHVNGYFIYQCTTILNYRLWLNRLGHIRVEQYGHGIYTMP